nr:MAG TPA: hypothetical protein [Caudoviricetes sp.]
MQDPIKASPKRAVVEMCRNDPLSATLRGLL